MRKQNFSERPGGRWNDALPIALAVLNLRMIRMKLALNCAEHVRQAPVCGDPPFNWI
jgi:hypothetical protein